MASHHFSFPLPHTLTLALGVVLIIWILCIYRRNKSRIKYPPGPRPWPVIGNLHQLGTLPHRTLKDLANKYGPIFLLRLGSVPTLVVSSPLMAKEIFKNHDLVFANRPTCSVGKYLCYDHKNMGFLPYGERWRQMRKLCTVEFLTAKRVESFKTIREEEVSDMIRSIWEESQKGMRSADVSKWVSVFTTNNICKLVAGRVYSDDVLRGCCGFKGMIDEMSSVAGAFCIGDFIPYLDWLDLQGIHRRMRNVSKIFDDFAEKVIDEHLSRRRKSDGEKQKQVKDLVDVLLDMAESEMQNKEWNITRVPIKGTIFDMLCAGIETSSTTIGWAMSELVKNPQILAKAQQELDSVVGTDRMVKESDLERCEYLRCIIKETFRLHPPLPLLIPRESSEDCLVGDYFIPKKTRVFVNVWAIGRDESVWENAKDFKPERFIGKDTDVNGRDFELIPFGSGRRGCPGILAGLTVVELGVAQLVHCFEWSVEGELNMEESFGASVPRKFPLSARPMWRLTTAI